MKTLGERGISLATGAAVFALLFLTYLANGDFLPGNDARATAMLAARIPEGRLSFSPDDEPWMFEWTLDLPEGAAPARVRSWDEAIAGSRAADLRASGRLHLASEKYYLVGTRVPGRWVSTFGPGAAFTAAPVFAVLRLAGIDARSDARALWYGAKLASSLVAALSAVFVYAAARRWLPPRPAAAVALVYGLGTCVWSLSSQTLWQHAPDELFLAVGAFAWTRLDEGKAFAALAGAAFGAATLCRPSSALVAACAGLLLALTRPRALPYLVLGGLPFAAAQAAWGVHWFGSIFATGQGARAATQALAKTGSAAVWQTPLWKGAAGLLISPSRGLFVFSPVLLLAIPGGIRAFREARFATLRLFVLGASALMLPAFLWFDWWGGWSFGYRPIVDVAPFAALLLVPVVESLPRKRALAVAFGVLAALSVAVQAVGAFSYDLTGWNARIAGFDVIAPDGSVTGAGSLAEAQARGAELGAGARVVARRLDIDQPQNRARLWSISDEEIVWYALHAGPSRRSRERLVTAWLADPAL